MAGVGLEPTHPGRNRQRSCSFLRFPVRQITTAFFSFFAAHITAMSSFWNTLTNRNTRPDAPTDFGAFTFDPSSAAAASSFLTPAAFYEPSVLHPLANLGGDLTYLGVDDAAISRLPGGQAVLPS